MINRIEVENFKLFKKIDLQLKNLNLFTGLNGTGKSSLIQTLLLLRQSHLTGMLQETGLMLKGSLTELGTGKDIFNQFAGREDLIKIKLSADNQTYYWDFGYLPDADILPVVNKTSYTSSLNALSLFNRNFQYLNAEHIIPMSTYKKSEFEVVQNRQIGKFGEYAAHYLSVYGLDPVLNQNLIHPKAKSNVLIHNVEAWLSEVSPGIKIVVEDIKGLDLVRLGFQYEAESGYTNEYKPMNVGFGITYAIPVILSLLTATADRFTIVENPESHVHPQGQAKLGELAAIVAANGCQVFVETHSDHFINGARVAVKESKIDRSAVRIFFFERKLDRADQESKIHSIDVDQNGELSQYPKNLLDEWSSQLFKLI